MEQPQQQFHTKGISYFDRIKKGLLFTIVICLIILFIANSGNNLFLTITLPLIIFIVYGYETLQWNKFYITSLKIQDNNVELEYLNYDKVVKLNLPLSEVNFKIRYIWYKVKPPHVYLQISSSQGLNLKQHSVGYWTKEKFMEAVEVVEGRGK